MASSSLALEEIIKTLDQMIINKTTINTIESNAHYSLETCALKKLQESLVAKVLFIFEKNIRTNQHVQAYGSFKNLKNRVLQRSSHFTHHFPQEFFHIFTTPTNLRNSRLNRSKIYISSR